MKGIVQKDLKMAPKHSRLVAITDVPTKEPINFVDKWTGSQASNIFFYLQTRNQPGGQKTVLVGTNREELVVITVHENLTRLRMEISLNGLMDIAPRDQSYILVINVGK